MHVVTGLELVDHGDGVVGVADRALAGSVQQKFLAAQVVVACGGGNLEHAVAELEAAETAMLESLASTILADLADETRELITQQEH